MICILEGTVNKLLEKNTSKGNILYTAILSSGGQTVFVKSMQPFNFSEKDNISIRVKMVVSWEYKNINVWILD